MRGKCADLPCENDAVCQQTPDGMNYSCLCTPGKFIHICGGKNHIHYDILTRAPLHPRKSVILLSTEAHSQSLIMSFRTYGGTRFYIFSIDRFF